MTKHGHCRNNSFTREYTSWVQMRSRCSNPYSKDYTNYGNRGITICSRWNSFELFYTDMGNRPQGTSLERKNNNGNYEPENCYWATPLEQAANRRSTTKYGAGISLDRDKFKVRFRGKYIGFFKTLEEAIVARKKAESDAKI